MIVELRARKRRRPRRAIIVHRWIVHDWSDLLDLHGDIIYEANVFVEMRWPRGPDAWEMFTCRICNRESLWDKQLMERPVCEFCDAEIDDVFE